MQKKIEGQHELLHRTLQTWTEYERQYFEEALVDAINRAVARCTYDRPRWDSLIPAQQRIELIQALRASLR